MNASQLATVECAYSSPEDKYWQTKECDTERDTAKGEVRCSCKHMSYYTIIDNKFDEAAYQNSLIVNIKIQNWIFFVPALYMVFLFILGIIYTHNKD